MYVLVSISNVHGANSISETGPCTHMIAPQLTCPLFDHPHGGGRAGAPAGENQEGPFWLMGHENSDLHCGRDQENHREGGWPAQQPQWTDGRLLATSGLRSLPRVIKPLLTGTPISSSEDQLSYVRQSSSGWTVTVLRQLHYRWNSVDKIKIYRRAEWHAERTKSI